MEQEAEPTLSTIGNGGHGEFELSRRLTGFSFDGEEETFDPLRTDDPGVARLLRSIDDTAETELWCSYLPVDPEASATQADAFTVNSQSDMSHSTLTPCLLPRLDVLMQLQTRAHSQPRVALKLDWIFQLPHKATL